MSECVPEASGRDAIQGSINRHDGSSSGHRLTTHTAMPSLGRSDQDAKDVSAPCTFPPPPPNHARTYPEALVEGHLLVVAGAKELGVRVIVVAEKQGVDHL